MKENRKKSRIIKVVRKKLGKIELRRIREFIKENVGLLIIILLILFISIGYIADQTIYEGMDTAYHMSRIIGITNSWKEGDFLAFIHSDASRLWLCYGFFLQ